MVGGWGCRVFVDCIFTEGLSGGEHHADESLVGWQLELTVKEIIGMLPAAENGYQVITGAV